MTAHNVEAEMATTSGELAALTSEPQDVPSRRILGALRRPRTLVAGAVVLLLLFVALTASWIAPYDPAAIDIRRALEGPSVDHWLGTDELGRDTLSRLIFGTRVALLVSIGAVAIAMAIGVPFGLLMAYRGGRWDWFGARVLDVFDSIPGLLIAFAVIAALGRGLWPMTAAIGVIFTMSFARMARAMTLVERNEPYVDAARVGGLRDRTILTSQILPNILTPLTVQAAVYIGIAISIEAALSFLGLGLDTSASSWGGMLSDAAGGMRRQPFLPFPPGAAIIIAVLCFNYLGDGVRGRRSTPPTRVRPRRRSEPTVPSTQRTPTVLGERRSDPILDVRGVQVSAPSPTGDRTTLLTDVHFEIAPGEILGLVGESGSGKSTLARAIMGLERGGVQVDGGSITLDGRQLVGMPRSERRSVNGVDAAMIFQDPISALSPVHTVGEVIREALGRRSNLSRAETTDEAIALLTKVGVPEAASRLDDYPHQFSGGLAQRVAIAVALACRPRLLVADEPTSALDVTTQKTVLDLLLELREEFGMAILLITHDLAVVSGVCDRVAVMYAGEIVEIGNVRRLLGDPHHPYTRALIAANPVAGDRQARLPTIPGRLALPGHWSTGCRFEPRCAFAKAECGHGPVPFVDDARCLRVAEISGART